MEVGWSVNPTALGITGSRKGATTAAVRSLSLVLQSAWRTVHPELVHLSHGDCVGVDQVAHQLARAIGGFRIYSHPPLNPRYRAYCRADVELDPLDYLVRNEVIAASNRVLLAVPETAEETLRSGTWATVRYAREIGVPVKLILPDGEVVDEH